MKLRTNKTILSVMIMLATGIFAQAAPEWVFTHGHSGQRETPATWPALARGWGLDGVIAAGQGCWVHYTVPHETYTYNYNNVAGVNKQWKVRYLRLTFQSWNLAAGVRKIHVWNGPTRVKIIEPIWHWGAKDLLVDLGASYTITRGLGISLDVAAQNNPVANRRLMINGIGARWD